MDKHGFIETLILHLALVIFAIYGVYYLAPKVAETVSDHLIHAAQAGDNR